MSSQKIVCITGHIGTGKTSVASKLNRDFKYHHICVPTFRKSKNIDAKAPIDKELVAEIRAHPDIPILLEGFPDNKASAISVESQTSTFQTIIHLTCKEETLAARVSKQRGIPAADVKEHIDNHHPLIHEVLGFYECFGIVRKIDSERDADAVYQQVKKALQPSVIFLYGAPKTGKSAIGCQIADRLGAELVEMREFKAKSVHNKDKFLMLNQMTKTLREHCSANRFVIDQLFQTKEELRIFCEELGVPQRIFYLDAPKDEVEKKMKDFGKGEDANNRYLSFVENRPTILDFIKDKIQLTKINACQTIENIVRDIMHSLSPKILSVLAHSPEEQNYVHRLHTEKGWALIDMEELIAGHSSRKSSVGMKIQFAKTAGKQVSPKHVLDCLKHPVFMNGPEKCVLLTKAREMIDFYESIQNEFKIQLKLVQVSFKGSQDAGLRDKTHPLIKYYEKGNLLFVHEDKLDILDNKIFPKTKYGLLFGPAASGKTTLTKAIAKQYGYVLVEWEPTINIVKDKYCTQEEKGAEEVPFPKVLKYFKETFEKNSDKVYILDGFIFEAKFDQFVHSVGAPTFIINLKVDKPILVKRTRAKNEADVNAELGEEESQKIDVAIQKGTSLAQMGDKLAETHCHTKSYMLDANENVDKTLKLLDRIFSKRVFVVQYSKAERNHIIEEALANQVKNLGLKNGMIFVDVGSLVRSQIHKKQISKLGKELWNQFEMRTEQDHDLWPYPYTPELIVRLINEFIATQESRDVIIYGYPTTEDQQAVFPKPSDQLAALESGIGAVRMITTFTSHALEYEIKDPELHLEKPVVEVKQKKEGEEGGDQPPAEEAKKTEFSIYDHKWTTSNGKPKGLAQWYCNSHVHVHQQHLEMKSYDDLHLMEALGKYYEQIMADPHASLFLEVMKHF